ncbi:MAG: saccharopine dehydrogenase [Calditrichaeota bacterium]|nr:MAG: saccharopine dehydrogenase [Calditrichota bacterium]
MKRVVVFGAGMIARPLIEYLLKHHLRVVVASKEFSPAIDTLLEVSPQGEKVVVDVTDEAAVESLVSQAEVVVSLLPYTIHEKIVRACLKCRKHLVTTSYLREDIKAYQAEAEGKGIIILMESGMDPGIDHMSACRFIDEVHSRNGVVERFYSYCGGLPAPNAANNPWKYKFSWSPRGVLLAARSGARYLENDEVVEISPEHLFEHCVPRNINSHQLESFPNRDALPYQQKYHIEEAHSVFRGTLRYPGWGKTMKSLREMGLLEVQPLQGVKSLSRKEVLGRIFHRYPGREVVEKVRSFLVNILDGESEEVFQRLQWIGLFGDETMETDTTTPLDFLNTLMFRKMQYQPGEEDMILMEHEFWVSYPTGKEKVHLTLEERGYPGKNGATAKCVSYPAAIATRLILEGKIKRAGTTIPVEKEIYQPILDELEELGIRFIENREKMGEHLLPG